MWDYKTIASLVLSVTSLHIVLALRKQKQETNRLSSYVSHIDGHVLAGVDRCELGISKKNL
jgi:hypothetical protein